MIFQSTNEEGITKADWMATLPLGTKVVTRRQPKSEDECAICNSIFAYHKEGDATLELREKCGETPCNMFFPAKYAIGTEHPIQREEGEGMELCDECSGLAKHHGRRNTNRHHSHEFKPVLYKVVSGMWHKEWAKNAFTDKKTPAFFKLLDDEAKLEGFEKWDSVLEYFAKKKVNQDVIWRVELERIQ